MVVPPEGVEVEVEEADGNSYIILDNLLYIVIYKSVLRVFIRYN